MRGERGVIWKREGNAVRRMEQRYREGHGPAPEVLSRRYRDAMREIMQTFEVSPFERLSIERQARVRKAYRDEIEKLEHSAEAGARAEADALRRMLAQMQPLESQRTALARTLQERMREDLARGKLALSLAPYANSRSRNGPDREPSR